MKQETFKRSYEAIEFLLKHPTSEKRYTEMSDLNHAVRAHELLLEIAPRAPLEIQLATFGHDVERAVYPPVNPDDWKTIEALGYEKKYREVHAARSASILSVILQQNEATLGQIKLVHTLVLYHEVGGIQGANMVREADILANFEWADSMWDRGIYSNEQLREGMDKKYRDLSRRAQELVARLNIKHKQVFKWIQFCARKS